jgi:hypothetical protein
MDMMFDSGRDFSKERKLPHQWTILTDPAALERETRRLP